ncbi:hypothetical protein B0A55_10620, partial [Friedmanniomyces simplex]
MIPITMTLPMEYQHILADSSSPNQNMPIMFSRQNYSYNPNGKPRNNGSYGFDPNSFMASPQPSYPDSPYTSQFGYGNMGFDSGYA